ncbi:hypothetical protein [Massilia sp. DWR3-1-1]|uniref:hypothetical protein n=1 Tax=Massilia sp. DWR3-1-1 TaxID=2804559 RepID=UPI003CEFD357
MRTLLLAAVSALCLTACSTPQERALKQQADMDRIIIEFGPACVRLGYTANSDLWRNCVLQLSTKEEITRYSNSTYLYGGWGGHPYWGGGGRWGR